MFSSNTSQVVATATQAEAIDFDGTNDYLSRSSDLVGNTDGKTFTFSAWIYVNLTTNSFVIYNSNPGVDIGYQYNAGTPRIKIDCLNAANASILSATTANSTISWNTFNHVLISVDLNNAANRSVYINDQLVTVTWTTYTNATINFTNANHNVGTGAYGPGLTRLSNIFLDYTYRDLSVTANRRLFITADRMPAAGQAALNPIMYLTMADPTQPGLNSGTGGNFSLTGTVARSGTGPNQGTFPLSQLINAGTYLQTGSIGGGTTSALTACVQFRPTTVTQGYIVGQGYWDNSQSIGYGGAINIFFDSTGKLNLFGGNSVGSMVYSFVSTNALIPNRNYILTFSVNLTSGNQWLDVYLNGQSLAGTTNFGSGYTSVYFANSTYVGSGYSQSGGSGSYRGFVGGVWISTSAALDLDVATNRQKFVTGTGINAKPVNLGANGELPTGATPRVFLPMYGNNAGKNYGANGDFPVYGGPYTGGRGINEWWGNWLRVPSGTGYYIRRTAGLTGITNTSDFTFSCWFYVNVQGGFPLFYIPGTVAGYQRLGISMDNAQLKVLICNSSDSGYVLVFNSTSTSLVTAGSYYNLLVSRNGTTLNCYLNGVAVTGTQSPSGSGAMTVTGMPVYVGAERDTQGSTGDFYIGELYFNTGYTDFSQEANRLKFRDAFGNPTDLPSAITAGSVPTPLVYLRMDPASPGTNAGTGGAFTSTLNIDKGQF